MRPAPKKFSYKILVLDSRLRFFPELADHMVPSVETVEITVYYGEKVRLREVVERVIECIEPNFSIFIDKCKIRYFLS